MISSKFLKREREEHISSVEIMLKKLNSKPFCNKIAEGQFMKYNSEWLGFCINKKRSKPLNSKIDAIAKLEIPETQKKLSFMESLHYEKFLLSLAEDSKPLRALRRNISMDQNI